MLYAPIVGNRAGGQLPSGVVYTTKPHHKHFNPTSTGIGSYHHPNLRRSLERHISASCPSSVSVLSRLLLGASLASPCRLPPRRQAVRYRLDLERPRIVDDM